MGEYRLTKDADADLLKIFLYEFETFGLAQAEEYRESTRQRSWAALTFASCDNARLSPPSLARCSDTLENRELEPGDDRPLWATE